MSDLSHPVCASAESITDRYRINLDEPDLRAWASEAVKVIRVLSSLEPIQAGGEPVALVHISPKMIAAIAEGYVGPVMCSVAKIAGDIDTPLFTRPATPVSAEVTVSVARSHYDQRMGRVGAFDDAPAGTKATEISYARAALATLDRGRG